MATYRFRATFEDFDDITRDIEIRSTQSFEDLHQAIHSAIGFDASKPASFYLSDDNWKKGKEFTTRVLNEEEIGVVSPVKNVRLCDSIIDPHQKIYYIFDFSSPWTFHIELIKINREEDTSASYPRCLRSTGEAPKQYNTTNIAALPLPDEDFDLIIDDELEEEAETEELAVVESELPEGEEKETFMKDESDTSEDDFETADDESVDDEGLSEKDDF